MSKFVKDLITEDIKGRLDGVTDLLMVNVIGLTALQNSTLRKQLRSKGMSIAVVKNSLARRAAEGTPLAPAFEGVEGTNAIVWGGEDIVSVAKEVMRLAGEKGYDVFKPTGGVMDGSKLSPTDVEQVSKWPNRAEQLAKLVGQILGPGSKLSSQIKGPGGALASQVKEKGSGEEEEAAPAEASA